MVDSLGPDSTVTLTSHRTADTGQISAPISRF